MKLELISPTEYWKLHTPKVKGEETRVKNPQAVGVFKSALSESRMAGVDQI